VCLLAQRTLNAPTGDQRSGAAMKAHEGYRGFFRDAACRCFELRRTYLQCFRISRGSVKCNGYFI
jgi:hypothetical protein